MANNEEKWEKHQENQKKEQKRVTLKPLKQNFPVSFSSITSSSPFLPTIMSFFYQKAECTEACTSMLSFDALLNKTLAPLLSISASCISSLYGRWPPVSAALSHNLKAVTHGLAGSATGQRNPLINGGNLAAFNQPYISFNERINAVH